MKSRIYRYNIFLLFIVCIAFSISSCDKNEDTSSTKDETADLTKIKEFTSGNYTFYLYKKDTGSIKTGYNEIYLQLKNNLTGQFVEDANLSWSPLMQMTSMSHACPYSGIQKVENTSTLYKGYFIFQMASSDMDNWIISYYYTKDNDTIAQTKDTLTVTTSPTVRFKSFKGSDSLKYYVALVNPSSPVVGSNPISAYLYRMVNMTTFTLVENYSIKIDPRMPDMDNHTSSNNVNLSYNSSDGLYKGTLNLTMTGYWKINLIVLDSNNTVIKGDEITGTTTASSIYFEIEL